MPEDVALILQNAGVGTIGNDIRMGRLPQEPARVVVVAPTGGRPAEYTHDGGTRRWPRVQVIVRDVDAQAAEGRAQGIRALLEALQAVDHVVNGRTYQAIVPLSEVFMMTGDGPGRSLFACNFECWL